MVEAGLLELLDGDVEPVPGFEMRLTPGHTPGHQVVLVRSSAGTAAFMGDLVPFASHFKINWIAGTDLDVISSIESKERFLAEVREKDYLVVLYHEHLTPVGRLAGDAFETF